ncbi:hypothetical protein EDD63_11832 [Breznakia blatticola]|uniref:Uncharacterized protein n=1 Tax=Breznakia blatticola TaxID=1754012 RepID=A0A4V3G6X7_9FIRM|nr:hypothetical protein [Breznakia blatticola]TDW16964.1 hypothetical protein EDD63_11832 [Breznakia blatticola]
MMKLLKYEIRRGYEQYIILFIAMLVVAVLVRFGSFSQIMNEGAVISEDGSLSIPVIAAIVLLMIYGLLVFGSVIFVGLQILRNFNTSMFKSQGYLTLTLPVSTSKLLISKTLVASLWFGLTVLVIFVSSVVMIDIPLTWENVFGTHFDMGILLLGIFEFMVGVLQTVLCAYMIITFVHTKYIKGHRILAAIIAYIVVSIVQMGVTYIFQSDLIHQVSLFGMSVTTSSTVETMDLYNDILLKDTAMQLAIATAWGAIYFFVCKYLLQRKIELD